MKLSVIMSVFNEKETIQQVLERVKNVDIEKEIIIVDDCSTDGTKERILEVGAGTGNITQFLLSKGEITCLDISPKCVEALKKKFINSEKISVFLGDICNLNGTWKGKIFDTVICLNVLEHIKDDKKALSNMTILLKSNGRLILLLPAYKWLYGSLDKNLGHYRRYESAEMCEKYRNLGLVLEKKMYFNLLGILGWFLNGKIIKRKILPSTQMRLYNLIVSFFRPFEDFLHPKVGLSLILILRKT